MALSVVFFNIGFYVQFQFSIDRFIVPSYRSGFLFDWLRNSISVRSVCAYVLLDSVKDSSLEFRAHLEKALNFETRSLNFDGGRWLSSERESNWILTSFQFQGKGGEEIRPICDFRSNYWLFKQWQDFSNKLPPGFFVSLQRPEEIIYPVQRLAMANYYKIRVSWYFRVDGSM